MQEKKKVQVFPGEGGGYPRMKDLASSGLSGFSRISPSKTTTCTPPFCGPFTQHE